MVVYPSSLSELEKIEQLGGNLWGACSFCMLYRHKRRMSWYDNHLVYEGLQRHPHVCVCNWPPFRGVCPNYEVVEFQPQTVAPPESRPHCLALHF